jgi:Ca-activated chloride channel family protein
MTDVAVDFEFDQLKVEEGKPVGRTYPRQLTDLFEGEQLVVVGRYKKTGVAKVKITGRVGDADQKFHFPVELVKKSKDQSYSFVEKLWAMRRIGEIIDELDLKGRNEELVKELVTLSTRHGVLTPYTSFLADENAKVSDLAGLAVGEGEGVDRAEELLGRLNEVDGIAGFAQRDARRHLREARQAAPALQLSADGELGMKLRDIDRDADVVVEAVQVVENQVLYKRGNAWYSFDVAKKDAAKLAAEAKVIERFSDEYFDLIRRSPAAAAKALARQKEGEAMMLEAAGEVYRVE